MRKIVYIIPGYREHAGMKSYQKVMRCFRKKGIEPIPVKITWQRNTMREYVEEFISQLKTESGDEAYAIGFSFGAMIVFLTAPFIQFKQIYLCSLSPYFKEDLSGLTKTDKRSLGKKRLKDFQTISFNAVAKYVLCSAKLTVGEKEAAPVQIRTRAAKHKIKRSKLIIFSEARHVFGESVYVDKLCECV
jgi:esterase/lipase